MHALAHPCPLFVSVRVSVCVSLEEREREREREREQARSTPRSARSGRPFRQSLASEEAFFPCSGRRQQLAVPNERGGHPPDPDARQISDGYKGCIDIDGQVSTRPRIAGTACPRGPGAIRAPAAPLGRLGQATQLEGSPFAARSLCASLPTAEQRNNLHPLFGRGKMVDPDSVRSGLFCLRTRVQTPLVHPFHPSIRPSIVLARSLPFFLPASSIAARPSSLYAPFPLSLLLSPCCSGQICPWC